MKHAGADCLSGLQALLAEIRAIGGLIERKQGTFYRKGNAFLHFHEDAAGIFADVKLSGASFTRLAVNTAAERQALLAEVRRTLAHGLVK